MPSSSPDLYIGLMSATSMGSIDAALVDFSGKHPVLSEISVADVQSTLCDLTATSIIHAINEYAPDSDEIYL